MQIDRHFCDGNKWNVHENTTGQGGGGKDPLIVGTKAMRDVADDFAAILAGLAVTGAAIPAASADPVPKADYDALVTRVNLIQTTLNALAAAVLKTVKVG
jgi:hypothetical protein